jgi:hypothetical protein
MNLSTKILIWAGAITIISALSFIIYKQIDMSRRQEAIEQNVVLQKQLVDGIVRSQASWATREDVEGLIKNSGLNLKAIQKDLDKLNADVSTINMVVATSQGQRRNNVPTIPGSVVNPNPVDPANPDPFGYSKQQQTLGLNEKFGTIELPIGSVGFSAWQKEPWNYDIKAREYHLNTVIGTDENQRQYFYNKFVVKIDGKDYAVPIQSAITEQVYPESKWSWWNPRLFLGIDGGLNITQMRGEFAPNVSVSFMSYGRYKTQPDFSILELGIGYGTISEKLQLVLTPVTYNVGQHIPLMNNTYIGPSIYIGLDGGVSFMLGTKVGL